jgi:hypothetical protein
MTRNSQSSQIDTLIDQVVLPLEEQGIDIISTDMVANCVLDLIDPRSVSPELIKFSSVMHLKQCVRNRLAKRHDPVEAAQESIESDELDLFGDQLQPYYPIKREGERAYARREVLSEIDIESNARRMEKAAKSLLQHAKALRAWFYTKEA